MANLDFFGVRSDFAAVFEFLFEETDVRIFELASNFGQELREFVAPSDLESAFNLGDDEHGNGGAVTLQLWSSSAMPKLKTRRIELDPQYCDGHTFRYELDDNYGACIQLYLGGIHGKTITMSHYGHNSEMRAAKWRAGLHADWVALKRVSNKIQYHLKSRLAVASVKGKVVLGGAHSLLASGYSLAGHYGNLHVIERAKKKTKVKKKTKAKAKKKTRAKK